MHYLFRRDELALRSTPVPNSFILNELPTAPEGYVKAYLYGLMACCAGTELTPAAEALGMPDAEVANAFTYWQSRGLVRVLATQPPTVEYLTCTAAAPAREAAPMVRALQEVLGMRMLSGSELERIYDWTDIFGLDEAAVLMLVRWCVENKGPRVSIKYMDEMARSWADAGVLTAEAAEARLIRNSELSSGAQRILKRWRKSRRPTEDELAMYDVWKQWGFDDEAIAAACARMAGVSDPSFKYLNGILESWRATGVMDTDAVARLIKQQDAAGELARQMFLRAGIKRNPSARELEQLQTVKDAWHMDAEVMLFAADSASGASSPYPYMQRLLTGWHDAGVTSVSAAKAALAAPPTQSQPRGGKNRFTQFKQRSYSADELKNIGVRLLDDDDDV